MRCLCILEINPLWSLELNVLVRQNIPFASFCCRSLSTLLDSYFFSELSFSSSQKKFTRESSVPTETCSCSLTLWPCSGHCQECLPHSPPSLFPLCVALTSAGTVLGGAGCFFTLLVHIACFPGRLLVPPSKSVLVTSILGAGVVGALPASCSRSSKSVPFLALVCPYRILFLPPFFSKAC